MESELFGHEKGAFTGAGGAHARALPRGRRRHAPPRRGRRAAARAPGEAAARAAGAQGRGPSAARRRSPVDVRVLAATNRDVEADVARGQASARTSTTGSTSSASSCRRSATRPEDVPRLAEHFVQRFADELGKDVRGLTPDALRALDAYAFPGNVRELENMIERAVRSRVGPLDRRSAICRRRSAVGRASPRRCSPICPPRAASSTRCSARSSGGSSSRRSSAPAACARSGEAPRRHVPLAALPAAEARSRFGRGSRQRRRGRTRFVTRVQAGVTNLVT